MRAKRPPLTEKEKADVYQRAAAGISRKEIAKELGLTYQSVTNILWKVKKDSEGSHFKPRQIADWPEGVNYE